MPINSTTEEHCGTDDIYLWEGQDITTAQACARVFSLKAISLFERVRVTITAQMLQEKRGL